VKKRSQIANVEIGDHLGQMVATLPVRKKSARKWGAVFEQVGWDPRRSL